MSLRYLVILMRNNLQWHKCYSYHKTTLARYIIWLKNHRHVQYNCIQTSINPYYKTLDLFDIKNYSSLTPSKEKLFFIQCNGTLLRITLIIDIGYSISSLWWFTSNEFYCGIKDVSMYLPNTLYAEQSTQSPLYREREKLESQIIKIKINLWYFYKQFYKFEGWAEEWRSIERFEPVYNTCFISQFNNNFSNTINVMLVYIVII